MSPAEAGGRRRDVLDVDRKDVRGDVLGGQLALRAWSSLFVWSSRSASTPEELPQHLDGDLVLFAEDLEEVRATDRDELRAARRR